MTVRELKIALAEFDDNMPVCLDDWSEEYATPRSDGITLKFGVYTFWTSEKRINGPCVMITIKDDEP